MATFKSWCVAVLCHPACIKDDKLKRRFQIVFYPQRFELFLFFGFPQFLDNTYKVYYSSVILAQIRAMLMVLKKLTMYAVGDPCKTLGTISRYNGLLSLASFLCFACKHCYKQKLL